MRTTFNNLITGFNYTETARKHLNNKLVQCNASIFDAIELYVYSPGLIHNVETVTSDIWLLSGEYGEPLMQVTII